MFSKCKTFCSSLDVLIAIGNWFMQRLGTHTIARHHPYHLYIWIWIWIWIYYQMTVSPSHSSLQWRHNERGGDLTHQPLDCLLNCLFRRRSKKTSRLRVTGFCDRWIRVTKGQLRGKKSMWWHDNGSQSIVMNMLKLMLYINIVVKGLDLFHIQSTTCAFIIADIIAFISANIYHVDAGTIVLSFFERPFHPRKRFVKWKLVYVDRHFADAYSLGSRKKYHN